MDEQRTRDGDLLGSEGWRDAKRYLWIAGFVAPALVGVAVLGWLLTGHGAWLWAGPIVVFGLVPLLDLVAGLDPSNPPDEVVEALENDPWYRWVTFLYLPLQYLGLAAGLWLATTRGLGPVGVLGLALTVGIMGGVGINTAHELGHKKPRHERWLARIALAQTGYGHFYIEHNRGHHVRVATPEDPASARLGETLPAFWVRSVVGSLRSAWQLERRRLARHGRPAWHPDNDILRAWTMTAAVWGAAVLWLGPGVVPVLALQAVVGILLLETVNYLEHYGLGRQRVTVGGRERYERVDPRHSWNSNTIVSNVLLYHLQRHSDHHAHPVRRYQVLREHREAPALPSGYAGMILLAQVPWLWRRVMDPRVLAHYGGDLSLANVHPRARARLERRWGATGPAPVAPLPTRPAYPDEHGAVGPATPAHVASAARCPGCGYTYVVRTGAPREGFAPGTAWTAVPPTWDCPDCGVRTADEFVLDVTVAT